MTGLCEGRPRWMSEPPPSALPARLDRGGMVGFGLACVGDELAVDDIGDPSLGAAHGLHAGLSFGELASVVGAAVGVEEYLGGRGDVPHVVHPSVPGAGEAMSDLVAGGRVEPGGAGPGREPV